MVVEDVDVDDLLLDLERSGEDSFLAGFEFFAILSKKVTIGVIELFNFSFDGLSKGFGVFKVS